MFGAPVVAGAGDEESYGEIDSDGYREPTEDDLSDLIAALSGN